MNDKPYFHEVEQSEVNKLITEGKSVDYVLENYKQPEWCSYHQALSMNMGCWSLCDLRENGLRTKISRDYCKNCELYISNIKV
jgi:predicted nucleic acid-binding Zn finger protein